MADRSSKISELALATSVGPADLLYLVQANTSKAVNAATLGIPAQLSLTVGPVEGNGVFASNGTANIAWFSFTNNTYSGVAIFVDALEGNNRTQGEVYVCTVGANVAWSPVVATTGANFINVASVANLSGNTVSVYFNRQSPTTANVTFRWQAKYFVH